MRRHGATRGFGWLGHDVVGVAVVWKNGVDDEGMLSMQAETDG